MLMLISARGKEGEGWGGEEGKGGKRNGGNWKGREKGRRGKGGG